MNDGSKTEHWRPVNPRTWDFLRRYPGSWASDFVRCTRTTHGFHIQIEGEEVAVVPTWDDVLAMTPILLGIYGKVKS